VAEITAALGNIVVLALNAHQKNSICSGNIKTLNKHINCDVIKMLFHVNDSIYSIGMLMIYDSHIDFSLNASQRISIEIIKAFPFSAVLMSYFTTGNATFYAPY
jgi:hypothetical protein